MGETGRRSYVKLDRYSFVDLGGKNGLVPLARLALVTLVAAAEFRSRSWTGTITDLAEMLGAERRTTAKAVDQLASAGLVEIVRRFGPNRAGMVRILAWEELIVPSAKEAAGGESTTAPISANDLVGEPGQECADGDGAFAPISANGDGANRAPFAPYSRSSRADRRDPSANDQPKGRFPLHRGSEGVVEHDNRSARGSVGVSEKQAIGSVTSAFPGATEIENEREKIDPAERCSTCGGRATTRDGSGSPHCGMRCIPDRFR